MKLKYYNLLLLLLDNKERLVITNTKKGITIKLYDNNKTLTFSKTIIPIFYKDYREQASEELFNHILYSNKELI